jgi:hypothetical protein
MVELMEIPLYNRQVNPSGAYAGAERRPVQGSVQGAGSEYAAMGQFAQTAGRVMAEVSLRKAEQAESYAKASIIKESQLMNQDLNDNMAEWSNKGVSPDEWTAMAKKVMKPRLDAISEAIKTAPSAQTRKMLELEVSRIKKIAEKKIAGKADLQIIKDKNRTISQAIYLSADNGRFDEAFSLIQDVKERGLMSEEEVSKLEFYVTQLKQKEEKALAIQQGIDFAAAGNLEEANKEIESLPESEQLKQERIFKELNKKAQLDLVKGSANNLLTDGNLRSAVSEFDKLKEHGYTDNEVSSMKSDFYFKAREIDLQLINTLGEAEDALRVINRDKEAGLVGGIHAGSMIKLVKAIRNRIASELARQQGETVKATMDAIKDGTLPPQEAIPLADQMDNEFPGAGFGDAIRLFIESGARQEFAEMSDEEHEKKGEDLKEEIKEVSNWQALRQLWGGQTFTYQEAFETIEAMQLSPINERFLINYVMESKARIVETEYGKYNVKTLMGHKDSNIRNFVERFLDLTDSIPDGLQNNLSMLAETIDDYKLRASMQDKKKLGSPDAASIFDPVLLKLQKEAVKNNQALKAMQSAAAIKYIIECGMKSDAQLLDEATRWN